MPGQHERRVTDVLVPPFLYGTAWKEDRTAELTLLALREGFRGIDTANQRRHYHEAGVGEAIRRVVDEGTPREALFLQTKFTSRGGQDHRLPYDPQADPATQVAQSFDSSLDHLGTSYLDAYVLHGPSTARGFGAFDRAVWRAMEARHAEGRARRLGVSNVSREQLDLLVAEAGVPPSFVQNRCFAATGWDRDVREWCAAHDAVYQGFSLLTANVRELGSAAVQRAAHRTGRTPAQVVFAFARHVGMLPLTGTTDPAHMREDLESLDIELAPDEVTAIEACGERR